MSTHWTCCTPRQHSLERSDLFSDTEWNGLYTACEELFDTNKAQKGFDDSVRQRLVKETLIQGFQEDFKMAVSSRIRQHPVK